MARAICDAMAGGYELARAAEPPRPGVWFKHVAAELRGMNPWLMDARLLNFEGSSSLEKHGLTSCFQDWVANRVYYFYAYPERSEHPANRKRGNIRAVYAEFYAVFGADVAAREPVSEARAREFWISVSDRVPFQAPPRPRPSATAQTQPDKPRPESVGVNHVTKAVAHEASSPVV